MVSELFQKNTFANLCKPIHDAIIIKVSSNHLNLETVERNEIKISKIKYSLLDEKNVSIIFEMLSFGKI